VPIADPPPRALRAALAAAVVNGAAALAVALWVIPVFPLAPGTPDAVAWSAAHRVAFVASILLSVAGVGLWLPFLVFLARAVGARGQVALGGLAGAGTGPDIAAQLWALFGAHGDPGRARAIELVSGGVATACYGVVALAIAASALGSGRSRRALLVGGFGLLAAVPALAIATLCILGDGGLAFFGPTSVRPLFVAWAVAVVAGLRDPEGPPLGGSGARTA
jgi:hypothetical protein